MAEFKSWIMTIAGTVLILAMIDMILPSGKTRKTVTIASGFILMAVLIIPMIELLSGLKNNSNVSITEFLAVQERQQIIENSGLYTEDQLALIAANYKSRLKEHINAKVMTIPGVGAAGCDVLIKEDYMKEDFGVIEKVYISAVRKDEEPEDKSRLGKVKKIEKIIIDGNGFRVEKSGDSKPQDPDNQELINRIRKEISNDLLIEENLIIVEIKN